MFPLADARGNIVGFQARKLRDDDPLRGKYVNSPESELFHKSHVLYGLHLARPAIAKQERAVVVEGNTDVIALRQAGFEPVVASMGTALTEAQLRELGRLTKRLFLCFDSDAAGAGRNAARHGARGRSRIRRPCRRAPEGPGSGRRAGGFEERLGKAESYLVHRVRLELARGRDPQESFIRARNVLEAAPNSPERREAAKLIIDALNLPAEVITTLAVARDPRGRTAFAPERQLRAAADLERQVLAACLANPALVEGLGQLSVEHFDDELHRRFYGVLVGGAPENAELTALHAELDARAARESMSEQLGKELLLRLHERSLLTEIRRADLVRATELQAQLAKVRQALAELA